MEVKQIKELMLAMGRTGTKKLLYKKDGEELVLESQDEYQDHPYLRAYEGDSSIDENPMRQEIERHRQTHAVAAPDDKVLVTKAAGEEKEDTASVYVTSPMVGTVYFAPSPTDPVFIKPGDRVEKGTVVCIIEAMKVMNEVKAGVSGVVSAPLIENGHPVEFGSKLFRITPQ